MRKKCGVLLLSFLVLGLIGCGQNSSDSTGEVTNKKEEVSKTQELDINLDIVDSEEDIDEDLPSIVFSNADMTCWLPKGFKEVEGENGIFVHKNYPKDSATITYTINKMNDDVSKITQEEFELSYEDYFYNTYGDDVEVTINQYQKVKVNGRSGLYVEMTYALKGTEYEQFQYMIYNGEESHILNYTQEKSGKWAEEFKKSIESVAFAE